MPGSGVAATCRSRRRPPRTASGRTRWPLAASWGRGTPCSRLLPTRSRPAAPRRPSAAAPSTRTRQRFSRRGWRSVCVSACAPPESRSTSARRCGACTARRAGSRRTPARARCALPPRSSRSAAPRNPRAARCADALTITSSHIVLTEPVPDLLEEIGWTGGECITDCRTMMHYFRTTPDGRIAFGWGGGRISMGGPAWRTGRGRPRGRGPGRRAPPRLLPGARGAPPHPCLGRPDRRLADPSARGRAAARRHAPSPPPATPAMASVPRTWSAEPSPRWPSTAATSTPACRSSTHLPNASHPSPSTGWAANAIRRAIMSKEEAEARRPLSRPRQLSGLADPTARSASTSADETPPSPSIGNGGICG